MAAVADPDGIAVPYQLTRLVLCGAMKLYVQGVRMRLVPAACLMTILWTRAYIKATLKGN